MTIPILYEDDAIVVVNKPPGVIVNRAQSVKVETIQDWVEATYPSALNSQPSAPPPQTPNLEATYDITQEFHSRSGVVHRIDKETSGILVIAKSAEAFGALKQQFMDRTIQKTYLAIVHDKMPADEGEINAPIDRLPWDRERWGVVPDGREALTLYKVLKTFEREAKKKKESYQLVECYPKTGRTHQIRVHLKYVNHPIVGDYLYAGRKTARDDRTWAPRVMLHAAKIQFTHPVTNQPQIIEAPLPEDMSRILE